MFHLSVSLFLLILILITTFEIKHLFNKSNHLLLCSLRQLCRHHHLEHLERQHLDLGRQLAEPVLQPVLADRFLHQFLELL